MSVLSCFDVINVSQRLCAPTYLSGITDLSTTQASATILLSITLVVEDYCWMASIFITKPDAQPLADGFPKLWNAQVNICYNYIGAIGSYNLPNEFLIVLILVYIEHLS